ncbi:MAG: DUF2283 domain-containing protein [Candidatus Pacearchaeota archaeon]|nr:DUF2283 domain-containing protein [Candidatus Pacearchaeota archaeon]
MEKKFFYDEFSDRLMISNKKPEEKIIGSARILNVTLDFAANNKIVNIEIKNISEYLDSLGLDAAILNNLESAELVFKHYRDGYLIYFILTSTKGQIERVPFNVPMNKILVNA